MTINGRIDQHSQSIEAFFDSIGQEATYAVQQARQLFCLV
jgi:hypothetical protein